MLNKLQQLITAGVIAATFQSATAADLVPAPPVPAIIQVPAGHTAFLKGEAIGTQNYVCLPSATGVAWKLFGPQATLFFTFKWFNGEIKQQIMTHYLSPNPVESGTPRPAWQSSLDTSAVWAIATASSTDPNYVAAGAIPWLRLQIVGTQKGPTGGASLTPTTFIHRVNTAGGVAPSDGCSVATDLGKTAHVPYTTDYYFYKASK